MAGSAIVADADLMIVAGAVEGRLSGSGSHLSFETSHLAPFLASVPRGSNRVVLSAANRLASMGLSVSVIEDGVAVFDIGNVEPSLLARAFGRRDVRIRRPLRLLMSYLRR